MLVEDAWRPGQRTPCPVCGHPTGDCAPEGGSDHVRILPAEPESDEGKTFTVDREVHQELYFGKRRSFVRLFHKGSRITPEQAEELGLLEDDLPDVVIVPIEKAFGPYEHLRP